MTNEMILVHTKNDLYNLVKVEVNDDNKVFATALALTDTDLERNNIIELPKEIIELILEIQQPELPTPRSFSNVDENDEFIPLEQFEANYLADKVYVEPKEPITAWGNILSTVRKEARAKIKEERKSKLK